MHKKPNNIPFEQRGLTMDEVAECLGIGRTQLKEMVEAGHFPPGMTVYPGGRRKIWWGVTVLAHEAKIEEEARSPLKLDIVRQQKNRPSEGVSARRVRSSFAEQKKEGLAKCRPLRWIICLLRSERKGKVLRSADSIFYVVSATMEANNRCAEEKEKV